MKPGKVYDMSNRAKGKEPYFKKKRKMLILQIPQGVQGTFMVFKKNLGKFCFDKRQFLYVDEYFKMCKRVELLKLRTSKLNAAKKQVLMDKIKQFKS